MRYLIFCSFEVGGFPYRMAEILNAHGVETYYASIDIPNRVHDSTQFHYGRPLASWDLSPRFGEAQGGGRKTKALLNRLQSEFRFTHILATGQKAYLLREAGLPYHYWSYGADLDYQVNFFQFLAHKYPWWARPIRYLLYLSRFQRNARRAITGAQAVMIAPYQLETYQKVCPDKPLFFLPHFFAIEDLETLGPQKEVSRQKLAAQIGARRFFFSSSRHLWAGPAQRYPHAKGNDVILRAFRNYQDLSGDQDAKLVLVAKGPHVAASKALAQEINITPRVVWVEEMKRAELNQYYQGAGLCLGQFGTPVLTYAALEPMAQANISISALERIDPRVPFYQEAPPIFSSKEPREIAEFMAQIMNHPQGYADLCRCSWQWIKDNCSEERFVAEFVKSFSIGSGCSQPGGFED